MKTCKRLLSALCVFAICFCCTTAPVFAATGPGDTLLPNSQVFPDPDQGGSGLNVDYLFHLVNTNGISVFAYSNDYYTGRTMLSGTERFGYVVTMYHSLASSTTNYGMRGGVCYWSASQGIYDPVFCTTYEGEDSGKTRVRYIEKSDFSPNQRYYVFLRNLMGNYSDSYVTGSIYFFRDPV